MIRGFIKYIYGIIKNNNKKNYQMLNYNIEAVVRMSPVKKQMK